MRWIDRSALLVRVAWVLFVACALAGCAGRNASSGALSSISSPAPAPRLKLSLSEPAVPAAALPAAHAARPYRVGVSLLTRDDEFYKALEEGLKKEAARQRIDITVTSADKDLNKQINQTQNFIAQKMDAVVLCPVDSQGIFSAVAAANKANIPVFTADIASTAGKVVCHIASDNVAGGKLDGQYLGKLLDGKGSVAILDFSTVTSVVDRVKGFKQAIASFPGIHIVADEDVEGAKIENAVPKATDILTAHPEINAIFGINDPVALGALSALRQLNRTNVVVVGFDAVPEAQADIAADTALKADAIQYPRVIGAATVDAVVRYLNGQPVPPTIPIPTGLVQHSSFVGPR
ncbi:MAG TPA: substrate-binding domain-containing protein [Chthonomonadales bacterium]|nr:substrate-binding domain-containing protein [Chthonomonadales bacterium]